MSIRRAHRIPVAPAAHYACGGVPARLDGATALAGLYAVGEVSCTGVHGANRLASNSLTESVVAGTRLGRDLAWELPEEAVGEEQTVVADGLVAASHRIAVRSAMSRHAGVVRDAAGLAEAAATLDGVLSTVTPDLVEPSQAAYEATNVATVARALLAAAAARTESRGCHRRVDHPEPLSGMGHSPARGTLDVGRHRTRVSRRRAAPDDRRAAGFSVMTVFHPLSTATRDRLSAGGLDPDAIAALVRSAIAEDLMGGIDVTSEATVPARQRSVATFGSRDDGVVAGLSVAAAVIDAVCGPAASDFDYLVADGQRVVPGTDVARVTAPTRLLLTSERSALNLLCHLSGVATLTRRWADALAGTPAMVRDTRKTLPGLRAVEKYAVRVGGGSNHRMGLSDATLVKDNHVMAAGGVAEAFAAVRSLAATLPVEIEVDSIEALVEALDAGADVVMLDNFTIEQMGAAVAVRNDRGPGVVLEASGGLTLEVARRVGETGVDFVAVGELTHSAPVLDIGLDLEDVLE